MLNEISTLHTLAQIGVALSGFAGLAAAVGVSSTEFLVAFARLRGVVLSGLLIAVGAMVPILVEGFEATEGLVWRISAGLLLLLNWTGLFIGLRLYGREATLSVVDKFIVIPLEVTAQLALLVVIFGFFSNYAATLVLTFLVLVLMQGIAMFLGFFEQVFSPDE